MTMIINKFDLSNQNVLITGGMGHLGKAMVSELIKHGANVISIVKSAESIKKAKILSKQQKQFSYFEGDINSDRDLFKIKKLIKDIGKLNCIINNAYTGTSPKPYEAKRNDFLNSLDVSVVASYNLTIKMIEFLKKGVAKNNNASVINISSMYSLVSPQPDVYKDTGLSINPINYGVSKAGLNQLTKYLAIQLSNYGIRVNSVSPGAMPKDLSNKKFINNLIKNIPLKRIGKPDDLTGTIIFLSSKASSYVTGTNINVDGGWTIW